jgi:parvulin-like peptidyl-prolyl isomerase
MLRHLIKSSLLPLLLVMGSASSAAYARVIEQIVMVINGEPYTLSNLSAYAKSKMARDFPTRTLDRINASDREVLEQFITERLLDAEIREAGIRVTAEDVELYISQIKQKNRLTDAE